jgi:hypothetical protein
VATDHLSGSNYDKRFYGIYRGVVTDSNDPENLNRIKMQVPQILGKATTSWSWPIVGVPVHNKTPYGSFYDTTASVSSATTEKVIALGTTADAYGVSIVDGTKMTFKYAGVYNIQFSAQVYQSANGNPKINFWIKKNGTRVEATTGQIDLSNQNHYALPAWNYVIKVNAGDYIEFWWNSSSTTALVTTAAGTYEPAAPAMIATATLAGGYIPDPGDGCWVMFEGGDPNFPLWLGAF